jgi:hypothetical protein
MQPAGDQPHVITTAALQVDEAELRAAGYSPATILELQRWRQSAGSLGQSSRPQHTKTAVAAIKFIMEHEPNPGVIHSVHQNCLSACAINFDLLLS